MKKQYIIPVFVPYLGCPNACTFCNQRKISGEQKNVTPEDVRNTIEYYLKNFKDNECYKEVAFFGGSFTGIDEKIQNELLEVAYEYVKSNKINGIRISTRPDYINKSILKRLKKYKVKTIELGVQSTNNYILNYCKRGHTKEDVVKASKLIRRFGFVLGHQMMIGLPESTALDEINTAKDLIKLKPKIVRIYPVLVIKGTELEEQYIKGEYEPLELNQAIARCKDVCYLFNKHKINVIRIGLQTTDRICSPNNKESDVVAGPYHETFRQLVESSIYYDMIVEKIKKVNVKVKEIEVEINSENLNNVVGFKKENIVKLKELYDVNLIVKENNDLKNNKFITRITKIYNDFLGESDIIKPRII